MSLRGVAEAISTAKRLNTSTTQQRIILGMTGESLKDTPPEGRSHSMEGISEGDSLKVYLGLGSNLGERRKNIEEALALLMENDSVRVKKVSSLIETEPEGVREQPFFLNGVAEIETDLSPSLLLKLLKSIEKALGRKTVKRWGPRNIDLDILLYGDLIIADDNLKIPHPLLTERNFALTPLREIAPDVIHPISGKKIQAISQKCLQEVSCSGVHSSSSLKGR